jgi:PAS domain S-box-containing protein
MTRGDTGPEVKSRRAKGGTPGTVDRRGSASQKEHVRDLRFLSRTAMELAEFPPEQDIYEFIASRLGELAGNALVIVNSFDETTGNFQLRSVAGAGEHHDFISDLLGGTFPGISIPISDGARIGLTTGRLENVPGGIHELACGAIPQPVCDEIEKRLCFRTAYAIGFAWQGRLFASAAIIARKGTRLREAGVIEAFVHQTSVALQRRQIEEALRSSEAYYRSVLENTSDVTAIIDGDARVQYASPSMKRVFGFDHEEVIGKVAFDYIHPDYLPAAVTAFNEHRGKPGPTPCQELSARCKDDTWRYFEVVANNLLHDPGVSGFVVEVRDVTERKTAEKALQESERRFRDIFDNVNDEILIGDARGVIVNVNRRCQEIFGYRPDEVIGRHFSELGVFEASELNRMNQLIAEVVADGSTDSIRVETRAKRKDGRRIFLEVSTTPVRSTDGSVEYFVNIIRDISKRKRAEEALRKAHQQLEERVRERTSELAASNQDLQREIAERKATEHALRESEARYRLLAENATDVICRFDSKLRPIYISPSMERLLGFTVEEAMQRTMEESLTPSSIKLAADQLASALASVTAYPADKPRSGMVELEFYRKDGSTVWVEATVSQLRDSQGKLVEMVNVLRDVSQRKRAELERYTMEQQLHLTGRLASVGQLAAGVAHELNNPLTAVQGFAQLLASRSDLGESIKKDVDTIYMEAQRATRITSNLLSFARRHKPEKSPISVNDCLAKSLELHTYRMRVNNIAVSTELAPDVPTAMADYYQLQQVFVNLITNAEQAMTETHGKGRLMITTEALDHLVKVTFTDDGPGIPKDGLKSIFDPFFTTKEVGKGTGLGLSICCGIMQEHGGRIYATSNPGRGATFVVEIPTASENGPVGDHPDHVIPAQNPAVVPE